MDVLAAPVARGAANTCLFGAIQVVDCGRIGQSGVFVAGLELSLTQVSKASVIDRCFTRCTSISAPKLPLATEIARRFEQSKLERLALIFRGFLPNHPWIDAMIPHASKAN